MAEQQHENSVMTTSRKHKRALPKLKISINLEARSIVELINLGERIDFIARTLGFITHKDHKLDFRQNALGRLINPGKNKLGKVSKLIIQEIRTYKN